MTASGVKRDGLNIPHLGKASGPFHERKLCSTSQYDNLLFAAHHRNSHSSSEQLTTG
ncbi:hypothetical protein [Synechococcus sp. MIT S1220]|uniref:hypothetical protein n=1 Tax=Synechococcus sp. MIT S1220 TaxID=3082549 RepID=UPI0039AF6F15